MVTNPVQKKQEEFFDELLESIRPNKTDIIERKIHHIGFAKVLVWLCMTSKKRGLFYRKDLRNFMRLTNSRITEILTDLIDAGLLRKVSSSGEQAYYVFVKKDDSSKLVVNEYFHRALKTLGMTPRKKVSFEVEEELNEEEGFL